MKTISSEAISAIYTCLLHLIHKIKSLEIWEAFALNNYFKCKSNIQFKKELLSFGAGMHIVDEIVVIESL